MKKLLLILSFVAITNFCFSQVKGVSLVDKKDHCGPHNSCIPIVTSDDDEVTIKCDSTLYNVDIVICDQWGNVMYHSTQTVGPNETILYVPNLAENSEKTTIDLYYGRKHLRGIFDE